MDEEAILFLYEGDASGAIDELAAFDEALLSTDDLINQLGGGTDALTGLDDAIAALTEAATSMEEMISAASASLDELASNAESAAASLDAIDTTVTSLESLATAAEDAAAAMDGLGVAEGSAGAEGESAFSGGAGIMGLTMLSGLAMNAGKSFFDMGNSAEDSFAQVQGMAGVTQQQMGALIPQLEQDSLDLHTSLTSVGDALYYVESAGYSGKDALTVEHEALEAASASGANFQDVASALTGELHSYNASASDAKTYTDQMIEGVVQGKQTFQDFASAIGPLASIGHQTGMSFAEIVAAEATMTQINPHVRQDATDLNFLLRAIGLNNDKVAATATKMGLSFDENAYKSMNLTQRLQYLQQISGGNQTDFAKLVGGATGLQAAMDILSNKGGTYAGILDKIKNSSGATDQAFKTTSDTMGANSQKVGAALSVLSFNLVQLVSPYVSAALSTLSGALTGFSSWMETHGQTAIPILIGLATALGTVLVGAAVAMVGPVLAAVAPFALIGVAIGGLVAGIILLVQRWGQISSAIMGSPVGPVLRDLGEAFKGVGQFIASLFIPVWQQLQQVWNQQIMPALRQLMPALKELLPVFQIIGAVIGGSLLLALGLLVGVITGLAKGVSYAVEGIGQALGGFVQMWTGILQFIGGIVQLIVDIIHGNWSKIVPDLMKIAAGILNIWVGLWNMVAGAAKAVWGLISGFFGGLVQGIIAFFQHLYDAIIGHSLIPDLVHGIIDWIGKLPGEIGGLILTLAVEMYKHFEEIKDTVLRYVQNMINNVLTSVDGWVTSWLQKADDLKTQFINALQNLWTDVTNFFTGLPAQMLTWGEDMINGFINGITNAAGGIGNALGGIGSKIKGLFGFSVPTEGPLSTADRWMPDMMELFTRGITDNQGKLQATLRALGLSMQVALQTTAPGPGLYSAVAPSPLPVLPSPGAPIGAYTAGQGDLGQIAPILLQILDVLRAGQQNPQLTNIALNNTINNPTTDLQLLYNLLQSLGGFQYQQSLQRGALGL